MTHIHCDKQTHTMTNGKQTDTERRWTYRWTDVQRMDGQTEDYRHSRGKTNTDGHTETLKMDTYREDSRDATILQYINTVYIAILSTTMQYNIVIAVLQYTAELWFVDNYPASKAPEVITDDLLVTRSYTLNKLAFIVNAFDDGCLTCAYTVCCTSA